MKAQNVEISGREFIQIVGGFAFLCMLIGFFAAQKGVKPEVIEKIIAPEAKHKENPPLPLVPEKLPPSVAVPNGPKTEPPATAPGPIPAPKEAPGLP